LVGEAAGGSGIRLREAAIQFHGCDSHDGRPRGITAYADATVSPLVDQVSTDISAFKARKGKAIVYQGWADPVVNPQDTINRSRPSKARRRSSTPGSTDDAASFTCS